MIVRVVQGLHRRWVLRRARVGRGPSIMGWPLILGADVEIGDDLLMVSARGRPRTRLVGAGRILLGDRCFVNAGALLFSQESITLGDDVALADGSYIVDTDSHGIEGRPTRKLPVVIEDGVWIGARAMILPGVRIGSRAIVGAGAVVTKDVPADTLAAGNPARNVRRLEYPEGCTKAWDAVPTPADAPSA